MTRFTADSSTHVTILNVNLNAPFLVFNIWINLSDQCYEMQVKEISQQNMVLKMDYLRDFTPFWNH
jgi:hypothetical protein